MRRLILFAALLVAWPALARAQTYQPFGMVNIGTTQTGIRVGPFGCYTNSADPTYTNGQINPCSLTTTGRIRTQSVVIDATGNAPTSVTAGSTRPWHVIFVDSSGAVVPPADGGAGAVSTNTMRTVESAATSLRYISVGTAEDENQIKATAGVLRGISASNAHATNNAFIKCTNATSAGTTPGSTAIIYSMIVPASGGNNDGVINMPFSTALTCYIVLGKANSAVDEVSADDVSYTVRFD